MLGVVPLTGPGVARSKSSANGRLLSTEELLDELLEDTELDELLELESLLLELDDEELLLDDELLEELLEEPEPYCGFQPTPPPYAANTLARVANSASTSLALSR